MATVNLNLFARYQAGDSLDASHNRLLFNELGGTPAIPQLNSGDTLAITEYFFDDGNGSTIPFRDHRYAGSTVVVRLRASGNDTIYATATASSEIAPAATAPTVTPTGSPQKQRIVFASAPYTGVFTIQTFVGTITVKAKATAAEITALLQAIWSPYDNGLFATWVDAVTLDLQWVHNTGSWPAVGINVSDLQYKFGWNISVPLDGNGHTFTDLFLDANAPAYFEVVLDGTIAARVLLASSGSSGGSAPPSNPGDTTPGTGGSGLITGQIGSVRYDGEHGTIYPVSDYKISRPIERDNDCYLIRQTFRVYRPNYSPPKVGSQGPVIYSRQSYFVRDSDTIDLRVGLICELERTWVTVPNARVEYGKSAKNFKFLNPTYYFDPLHPNGVLTMDSVASYSNPIPIKIFFSYSIEANATNFPQIPDILFISLLNGQYTKIVPLGGIAIVNGAGNNFGMTFIDGDLNPWMGNIYERKVIYSLQ